MRPDRGALDFQISQSFSSDPKFTLNGRGFALIMNERSFSVERPMVRRPKKSKATPKDKRQAILDAALVMFAEQGFHGTSVPDVAKEAGVATGSIYRYFTSKEQLVNALYQQAKGAFLEALSTDIPGAPSARAQFKHFFQAFAAFQVASPARFTFLELQFHAPYLDKRSLAVEVAVMDFCRVYVRGAQAVGALKPGDPDLLIAIVTGGFVQIVKQRDVGRLVDDPHLLDTAEALLWDAVALKPPRGK